MFDLHSLVKDVCDTSSFVNDDQLTKEVLTRIDKSDERAALEQALPVYVRRFVSRDHRPLVAPQSSPTDQTVGETQKETVGGGAVPFRSRKVSSIRSAWQQWQDQLKARVNVGHKERKFFGDCTLDDLAFIARHRRDLAASNIAAAEYMERVESAMRELNVTYVRELPESAVNTLGEAA